MSTFLTQIGTKLADRWLGAVLLPGLLWIALLAAGLHLGQGRPFAAGRLAQWLDQLASRPAAHTSVTAVLAAGAVLLAAAGIGLLAGALGGLVERVWALPADLAPAAWLLRRRQGVWDEATRRLKAAILQAAQPPHPALDPARAAARVRALQRRRDRLGPARPVCPTRIGDRFARTTTRAGAVNGVDDFALVWPRLWTVLPEELRTDIATARSGYASTARLAAWGLLFTLLAAVWWPAALIGPAVLACAVPRSRAAADALAELIESATDLHLGDLAERLGITSLSTAGGAGQAVTARLRDAVAAPQGPAGTLP
ncbi:hypothetical protein OHB36_00240 [Streptomyces sp. NBC_00320]|uniref:hypothetical protein n=1 Tax=Streptomyces sp. NBC_00320 TaxID=2975711 RepID=UPI00225C07E3|nr:hypothetical protein [Streptomyces sp. NBC_00320]MCX5145214.1 hypothetical protein [Streptomyces sp. NBC_00320]